MNNSFIQNEHQRRKYMMEERQKRNRFMGWVLILIMLLFILPTYNLAQSYQQLLTRRQQLTDLKKQYQDLSDEKDKEASLATKLKDESYAAKYSRAKYYYSKSWEEVYTIPDLLPRKCEMENLLKIVEQFLSQSDEKLEELSQKNHLLRLQEEEGKKNA